MRGILSGPWSGFLYCNWTTPYREDIPYICNIHCQGHAEQLYGLNPGNLHQYLALAKACSLYDGICVYKSQSNRE